MIYIGQFEKVELNDEPDYEYFNYTTKEKSPYIIFTKKLRSDEKDFELAVDVFTNKEYLIFQTWYSDLMHEEAIREEYVINGDIIYPITDFLDRCYTELYDKYNIPVYGQISSDLLRKIITEINDEKAKTRKREL